MADNEEGQKAKKSLIRLAKEGLTSDNPSLLGDPVSLKAEAADSHPTENDRGAVHVKPEVKATTTRQTPSGNGKSKVVGGTYPPSTLNTPLAGEDNDTNVTMLGDPVSLKAETVDNESDRERKKRGSKL